MCCKVGVAQKSNGVYFPHGTVPSGADGAVVGIGNRFAVLIPGAVGRIGYIEQCNVVVGGQGGLVNLAGKGLRIPDALVVQVAEYVFALIRCIVSGAVNQRVQRLRIDGFEEAFLVVSGKGKHCTGGRS